MLKGATFENFCNDRFRAKNIFLGITTIFSKITKLQGAELKIPHQTTNPAPKDYRGARGDNTQSDRGFPP